MTKCDYCDYPAEVRCSKHDIRICGEIRCIQMHRWGGGNCNFVDPETLSAMDWLIRIGAAIVFVTSLVVAVAHL